jgi:alkane 1-monooxygenase
VARPQAVPLAVRPHGADAAVHGLGLHGATGWTAAWFWGPLFVFVLLPVLDHLVGTDRINPPDDAVPLLEQDRWYRWVTYLYLPLQYASLVWACWMWSTADLGWVGTSAWP